MFTIGDIVVIGHYTGTVTRLFSDGTIGFDDKRVDPVLFRVDIIRRENNTPYNSCRATPLAAKIIG